MTIGELHKFGCLARKAGDSAHAVTHDVHTHTVGWEGKRGDTQGADA